MEQIKERIIKTLDKYLGDNYLLFVFGSYARGNDIRSSDMDLAVYREEKILSDKMVLAKEDIEKITLREVDLINLTEDKLNPDLLENILKEAKIWRETKSSKELLRNLKKRLINLKK